MTEKLLSSRRVYDGRVINLRVDTVELPDGRTTTREVVEHHGAVAIVPLLDDGRVVLVRQYRRAVGEELLEIPAGTLEQGEDPDECAVRELAEETNYRAGRMERMYFTYLAPGYSSEGMHAYLARDLEPCQGTPDQDEWIDVERVPLAEAVGMIRNGAIKDAKSVAGILMASLLLGQGG